MRFVHRWVSRLVAVDDRAALLDVVFEPLPDPGLVLRRTAAETVILQDEAEDLLRRIRARENLGLIAPRGGPLVRRFFALQDALPEGLEQAEDVRLRDELSAILQHHAMALSVAMDFLACEWRSAALARQVDALDDLGPPARRLEEIAAMLLGRPRPAG